MLICNCVSNLHKVLSIVFSSVYVYCISINQSNFINSWWNLKPRTIQTGNLPATLTWGTIIIPLGRTTLPIPKQERIPTICLDPILAPVRFDRCCYCVVLSTFVWLVVQLQLWLPSSCRIIGIPILLCPLLLITISIFFIVFLSCTLVF